MHRRISRARARAGQAVAALSVAAVAAIILAAWLLAESLAANRMHRRADAAAAVAQQVVLAATALLQAVTDAETGLRGYLLTGQADLLDPYVDARRRSNEALAQLAAAAFGEPGLATQVARLGELANRRLQTVDANLKLLRSGQRGEAMAGLQAGQLQMNALRAQVEAVTDAAELRGAKLQQERRRVARRVQALQAGLVSATILAIGIAISALLLERTAARWAARLHADLTGEIEAARRAAEEADRAKSRFLAAASHDMRQPLHALALYISALERRVEGEAAREILGNMEGAVSAMTRLFTALLDMARLEAGVLKPEPIDFSVGELLQEVAEHSLDLRGRKDVRITVVPTNLRVRSDPDLLEIVLRNLASNAVKHSRGGRVLLGCRRIDGQVRIEVRDDGVGIPPDEIQRLFSEFVRGQGVGGTEGVGLGLSIVERMTKLLGHQLSVSSEVGCGSVFAITAPRAAEVGPPVETARQGSAPSSLRGVRVLVADDEPLALDAMQRTLRDAGAEALAVSSVAEVEARAHESFDLYVFDLNLGAGDGLELLNRLDRARGTAAPALIVTGTTMPETLAALRNSGRSWLTKPLTGEDLLAAAARLLAKPETLGA